MAEDRRHDCIETTFVELLTVIQEVSATDDEACAMFEYMLATGRIGIVGVPTAGAASPTPAVLRKRREAARVVACEPFPTPARSA